MMNSIAALPVFVLLVFPHACSSSRVSTSAPGGDTTHAGDAIFSSTDGPSAEKGRDVDFLRGQLATAWKLCGAGEAMFTGRDGWHAKVALDPFADGASEQSLQIDFQYKDGSVSDDDSSDSSGTKTSMFKKAFKKASGVMGATSSDSESKKPADIYATLDDVEEVWHGGFSLQGESFVEELGEDIMHNIYACKVLAFHGLKPMRDTPLPAASISNWYEWAMGEDNGFQRKKMHDMEADSPKPVNRPWANFALRFAPAAFAGEYAFRLIEKTSMPSPAVVKSAMERFEGTNRKPHYLLGVVGRNSAGLQVSLALSVDMLGTKHMQHSESFLVLQTISSSGEPFTFVHLPSDTAVTHANWKAWTISASPVFLSAPYKPGRQKANCHLTVLLTLSGSSTYVSVKLAPSQDASEFDIQACNVDESISGDRISSFDLLGFTDDRAHR